MLTLIRKLIKNKFIKNVTIIASGTALAQVIAFASIPFITRIYGPEAFGILGTFTSISSFVLPIAALTYPIAIVIPKSDIEAKDIMRLSLIVCLLIGLLSVALILIFSDTLLHLLNLEVLGSYLYLIPVAIVVAGGFQVIEQWIIRTQEFKVSAKTAIYQALIMNSSKIGIGLYYPLSVTLIVIQTFAYAIRGLLMISLSDKSIIKKQGSFNFKKMLKVACRYRDFPLYRSPQIFVNSASVALPTILLTAFFGPSAAGYFTLGRQVLNTPVTLLGKAVQDVFYPKIIEVSNDNKSIKNIILKAVLGLFSLGALPFGILIIFGPNIFSFIFGYEWYTAGVYARWISLFSLFMLITRPVIAAIPVLNMQRQFLFYEIVSAIIKLSALFIGVYYFNSDIYAVAFYSLSAMFLYIILTAYVLVIAKDISRYRR
ncbi:lipopolysaccharide biosynthesis protein [Ornithinibacillus halophilus]|uniref:Membrane protein involved in the export of O-antigen and teichoic acid n=1 Tax=Ornithinibacillus halophilus TaxID=930117 RepID=A0A1M5GIJ1_9BACI|nr:oligosaccharide flippase family protein [Ornithinibacillus halophilus]SHG03496.1 Membrane protein involved in the export of O-antigen and teichoic acid [Ornithinibacillus halophilus]